MALRGETFRLSGLRAWMANLLRAAASLVDAASPVRTGRTDDIDNSVANDPFGATIARLREQYPDAPEHWIRVLAEQTVVGNSRSETACAPFPAGGRQRRDSQERKRLKLLLPRTVKKTVGAPASFPSQEERTRRVNSAVFRDKAAQRPANGGAVDVAFLDIARRRYPSLSIPAVRIRWKKEPSVEQVTPARMREKNRRKIGLQFHTPPASERAPENRAEPTEEFADDKPLRRRPGSEFNPVAEATPPPRSGPSMENYRHALHRTDSRQTLHRGDDPALNEQPMQSAPLNIRSGISEKTDGASGFIRAPERDFTVGPQFEKTFLQTHDSVAPAVDSIPLRRVTPADGAEQSCDFRAEAPKWPDLPAAPHEGASGEAPRLGTHFWRQESAGLWNGLPF